MAKKYINEIVGDDYKKWESGDSVFLSAPTGSGKTTFVLKTLLPYCARNGIKILYLVNRKALKTQLEGIIWNEVPEAYWNNIRVELYHSIENRIHTLSYKQRYSDYYWGYAQALRDNNLNNGSVYLGAKGMWKGYDVEFANYNDLEKFNWVVCDECHYFLSDSTYNTYTMSSYYYIQRQLMNKVKIYMSATIKDIEERIRQDSECLQFLCTCWYNIPIKDYYLNNGFIRKFYKYSSERNYDYINIEIVNKYDEIPDLVYNDNSKWLIFVDSIEKGRKIRKEILLRNKKCDKNKTVVFVTSKYLLDEETASEMEIITTSSKQKADILIATSVLDNGINLQDTELRNIIAITDTETELIQMIGRKRADNQQITLYLFKQSREHFMKRLQICDKQYKLATDYYYKYLKINDERGRESYANLDIKSQEINHYEYTFIKSEHKMLLQKVMSGTLSFKTLKSCFFECNGILMLNTLSMMQLGFLRRYYKSIIDKFDNVGEDAFFLEQLKWLRKTEDCLQEAKKSQTERAKEFITGIFEDILNNSQDDSAEEEHDTKETVIELSDWIKTTSNMRDELKTMFDSIPDSSENLETLRRIGSRIKASTVKEYVKKVKANLDKSDRPLNATQMKILYTFYEIPYEIEINKGMCTIKRIEEPE